MSYDLRACWQNCYAPDDKRILEDKELLAIDAMEDSIAPLDDQTIAIRQLITRFEACYHEADKEAEYIVKSIAAGHCLEQSQQRPPERKKELENARSILSMWCENTAIKGVDLDVGGVPADELLSFIGKPSPLKIWQGQRGVDKITEALEPSRRYHWLALDLGDYGEPGARPAGEHYKDNLTFLEQTKKTIIHDTLDGRKSKVSLAMAIDMLMPCHWDFVGGLVIILKAIGGDLHPEKPFACCARNIKLSPLCDRMRTISNTLKAFWKGENTADNIDSRLLASLGETTPIKRWLAASLDKTIRLHLSLPFEIDLT
ncbi:MAG: hypothetical protein AMJ75_05240 [Phycisphaerae bacterium SM1_79]|nr:MAG: hypothetical protein AMJ75_05240 [Phycisphaerae bacterium SM1_79]